MKCLDDDDDDCRWMTLKGHGGHEYTVVQETEMMLEEERRTGDDARQAAAIIDRKRLALQTELEDVRALLETVTLSSFSHSFTDLLSIY